MKWNVCSIALNVISRAVKLWKVMSSFRKDNNCTCAVWFLLFNNPFFMIWKTFTAPWLHSHFSQDFSVAQGLVFLLSFWPCCRCSKRAQSPSPSSPPRIAPPQGRSRSGAASSKIEPSCGPAASRCCGSSSSCRPCRMPCVLGWAEDLDLDLDSDWDAGLLAAGLWPQTGPGDTEMSHCATAGRRLCWWWWSLGDSGGCASPKKRWLTCTALCLQHPWHLSVTRRETLRCQWKRWLSPGVCEILAFWICTGDYAAYVPDFVDSPLTFSHISSLCLCLLSCWSEVKVGHRGGRCIKAWWPWPGFCPATRSDWLMFGCFGVSHSEEDRPEVEGHSWVAGGGDGPPPRLHPPLSS